jgi:predicted amidohydrolase
LLQLAARASEEANADQAETMVRRAAAQGADIVVMPEMVSHSGDA